MRWVGTTQAGQRPVRANLCPMSAKDQPKEPSRVLEKVKAAQLVVRMLHNQTSSEQQVPAARPVRQRARHQSRCTRRTCQPTHVLQPHLLFLLSHGLTRFEPCRTQNAPCRTLGLTWTPTRGRPWPAFSNFRRGFPPPCTACSSESATAGAAKLVCAGAVFPQSVLPSRATPR